MSNSFFQFKKFTIHQSEAALKVCTEACIFGACIPVEQYASILDIGTGTGLLSLMLAQRSNAFIEAIELDLPSYRDAQKNFIASPWKDRLMIHQGDIKDFQPNSQFDLIICNPPFFIHHLKSTNARTNAALHGSELQPSDLLPIVNRLATDNGSFFILLPEKEMATLSMIMFKSGWKKIYSRAIYQEEHKNIFRVIAGFSKKSADQMEHEDQLIIYNKDRTYTPAFVHLLKDYYLYL
jgi:tRNA1Val (adenine37-N6)-methyltransferase